MQPLKSWFIYFAILTALSISCELFDHFVLNTIWPLPANYASLRATVLTAALFCIGFRIYIHFAGRKIAKETYEEVMERHFGKEWRRKVAEFESTEK